MKHFVLQASVRLQDGGADTVSFASEANSAADFIQDWRGLIAERFLGAFHLHVAAPLDVIDVGEDLNLAAPANFDDLMRAAIDCGGMSLSFGHPASMPEGRETGVYVGWLSAGQFGLTHEVAIAHDSLESAVLALVTAMPDFWTVESVCDAGFAAAGTSFDGKPVAAIVDAVKGAPPGQIHFGKSWKRKEIVSGSCLCGAVSLEITGPMRPVIACHCSQCRKNSGHHVAATSAARSDVDVTGEVTWYQSSEFARRGFCGTCGAMMLWDGPDQNISIFAGCLDGPTGLNVAGHIYCDDKGDYYEISDDLPKAVGWDPKMTVQVR